MKTKGINRRDFLRLSATGVGAFMLPGAVASTLAKAPEGEAASNDIPKRVLGRTGIELPILSMGVMRADNPNVVRAAYNSGIFHFDTANGYQNGRNEEMLGSFFEGKPRESFFIATKAKFDESFPANFEEDFNGKLATSLRRLKIDCVDIFYAHSIGGLDAINNDRLVNAMKKIKDKGQARFLGFSTHANKPEQIDAAIEAGIYDVILLSYNFKMDNLPATDAAIERAAKAGIGLVAMKTMTGGVEDAAGKKKIDARACLKWVWQNPHITTAIPGFANYDEFEECMAAAADTALTADERKYLASLRNREMLFCQQCGQCREQCPAGLPIPDIMRAYMYAYGYKHAQLAKETLAELNLPENACSNCGTCPVQCTAGFNVGRKIAAVTPVLDIPNEFLT